MTIWVLVADASRARLFSASKPASPLQELEDLANPEGRLHEGDLVTDKDGRAMGPGGKHGVDSNPVHKQEVEERFAIGLAQRLEKARAAGEFAKLYVVAPPHFLGLWRKHAPATLKASVAGELDKDLTTRDAATIRKQLPDYL